MRSMTAFPTTTLKLLVETDIETGLRWGELTELRVRDFVRMTRILTVSRAVVQVDPKFHPDAAAVPCQGLSQGRRIPPSQAQRATGRQDRRAHHCAWARAG